MPAVEQELSAQKSYSSGTFAGSYSPQEVILWSPEKIILKTYDFFMISCERRDLMQMNKALLYLMEALNFTHNEESTRLYRLYEYCQKCIFKKKYDEAMYIIEKLRDAWALGFQVD